MTLISHNTSTRCSAGAKSITARWPYARSDMRVNTASMSIRLRLRRWSCRNDAAAAIVATDMMLGLTRERLDRTGLIDVDREAVEFQPVGRRIA